MKFKSKMEHLIYVNASAKPSIYAKNIIVGILVHIFAKIVNI